MNKHKFQSLYAQLLDESTSHSAKFLIKEEILSCFQLFKTELDKEIKIIDKKTAIEFYNDIVTEQYPLILTDLLSKEYIDSSQLMSHFTSFLFDYKSYETQIILDKFTTKLIKKLNKKILENKDPLAIITELNDKITKSFVLDNSLAFHYNFNEASLSMTISQYTLSVMYLIIAEKIDLPIYGIPFEDKLVLCYAESYCTHNELVFEEDILFYIAIGEKDLVYTPQDLFLYAYLLEQKIDLKNRLPHSNQEILLKWASHIVDQEFDLRTRHSLSSKYQQIQIPSSEIENY